MRLTESIFRNIKEAESVKKPYGDKPQEGKKEKLERGKGKAVPKGKADNKFKVEKLENKNSQAAEIYPNDTAKYADKVDDKSHGDKGKIAKQNTTKASTTINKPFGDKIQASDSKLIKESEDVKECDDANCDNKELKEDYDNGSWMKHQTAIENELEAAREEMEEDAFLDFIDGIINLCQNYGGQLDQFESAKVEECNTKLKEDAEDDSDIKWRSTLYTYGDPKKIEGKKVDGVHIIELKNIHRMK